MTTPAQGTRLGGSKRTLRLAAYIAVAAVAIVLTLVDGALKTSSQSGLQAKSATWRVEAADLPGLYARWQQLGAYESFRENAPGSLQSVAVSLRKVTGVRPTPGRLRFWLGKRALISGDEGGWCVSVRPGLAFRLASLIATPPFGKQVEEPPYWQETTSAWRDGFFLVASSPVYLDAVLADGVPLAPTAMPDDTLAYSWDGAQSGTLELSLQEGLPIALVLPDAPAPDEPAALVPQDRNEAAVWVSLHGDPVTSLAAGAALALTESDVLAPAWERFGPVAEAWWNAYCPLPVSAPEGRPWSVGCLDADFKADIPTLDVVLAKTEDGSPWIPDSVRKAGPVHRWNDTEGRLIPVAGSGREWAVAEAAGVSLLVSGEHVMPVALAARVAAVPGTVAVCEAQWEPLAGRIADLLWRAAKEELLPGISRNTVSRDVAPVFDALGEWGSVRLHVVAGEGAMRGEGYLAQAREQT